MTPQLRQAIQLLQYSNVEASQFIEDELLKNPLLAHESVAAEPVAIIEPSEIPAAVPETADAASFAASGLLPGSSDAPLDIDTTNSYDAGTVSDGGGNYGSGGDEDDGFNFIDSLSDRKPCLREHLEQQARLAFNGKTELAIAAALIAGLDEAGRLA